MNETLLISILAASITAGTPILFAALGELISERAGVTNLGVDGMMLVGACAGFIAAQQTGSLLSGVGMALLAGSLMALIHAFLTVTLRANQVVSGLALTLFGTGLSGYLGLIMWGSRRLLFSVSWMYRGSVRSRCWGRYCSGRICWFTAVIF